MSLSTLLPRSRHALRAVAQRGVKPSLARQSSTSSTPTPTFTTTAATSELSVPESHQAKPAGMRPSFPDAAGLDTETLARLEGMPVPRNLISLYLRPLRKPAPYGIPVCNLQLRSYNVRSVEFFADFALRAAYYLGLPAKGAVPLPRITERWTVPRSPFIFKKSQENFERVTLRRLIQIQDGDPAVVQTWLAYLEKRAYHGVGMKADVWHNEPVAGSDGAAAAAQGAPRSALQGLDRISAEVDAIDEETVTRALATAGRQRARPRPGTLLKAQVASYVEQAEMEAVAESLAAEAEAASSAEAGAEVEAGATASSQAEATPTTSTDAGTDAVSAPSVDAAPAAIQTPTPETDSPAQPSTATATAAMTTVETVGADEVDTVVSVNVDAIQTRSPSNTIIPTDSEGSAAPAGQDVPRVTEVGAESALGSALEAASAPAPAPDAPTSTTANADAAATDTPETNLTAAIGVEVEPSESKPGDVEAAALPAQQQLLADKVNEILAEVGEPGQEAAQKREGGAEAEAGAEATADKQDGPGPEEPEKPAAPIKEPVEPREVEVETKAEEVQAQEKAEGGVKKE